MCLETSIKLASRTQQKVIVITYPRRDEPEMDGKTIANLTAERLRLTCDRYNFWKEIDRS